MVVTRRWAAGPSAIWRATLSMAERSASPFKRSAVEMRWAPYDRRGSGPNRDEEARHQIAFAITASWSADCQQWAGLPSYSLTLAQRMPCALYPFPKKQPLQRLSCHGPRDFVKISSSHWPRVGNYPYARPRLSLVRKEIEMSSFRKNCARSGAAHKSRTYRYRSTVDAVALRLNQGSAGEWRN
jgi:hypothetical protein